MNRLIEHDAVMLSIAKEYNRWRPTEGLRLAWIEKAVNDTPTAKIWHCPDDMDDPERLPPNMDFVLALANGKAGGIDCIRAPFIASFAPDDGWVLNDVTDRPGDSWKVIKWMAIPQEDDDEIHD